MQIPEKADELINAAVIANEQTFVENGEILPILMFIKDNETVIAGLPTFDEDKSRTMKAVNESLKIVQPEIALFSCECWVVYQKEYTNVPPSQHPERQEMVMILCQWKGGLVVDMYPILEHEDLRYIGERSSRHMEDVRQSYSKLFDGVFEEAGRT